MKEVLVVFKGVSERFGSVPGDLMEFQKGQRLSNGFQEFSRVLGAFHGCPRSFSGVTRAFQGILGVF